jgi:hypothetical protein
MEERPPVWWVAENILNKQLRAADKGWPSAWRLGEVLTTPHRKDLCCYEMFTQRWGQVAGTCECGNELSGSIKCGKFLDYLKTG